MALQSRLKLLMLRLQKCPERLFAALERSRLKHRQRPRGEV
jgi:hypothetical protein